MGDRHEPVRALDMAKYEMQQRNYAKFSFKQKYHRNVHPKMFILSFETVADQHTLTDEHKCLQFMFTLENEYLDWYKARLVANGY